MLTDFCAMLTYPFHCGGGREGKDKRSSLVLNYLGSIQLWLTMVASSAALKKIRQRLQAPENQGKNHRKEP
jgi:hypothetical protein